MRILCPCACLLLFGGSPQPASGHGDEQKQYRTRVLEVRPRLPVEVRVSGDRIRFENQGDEVLVLCGYEPGGCEGWVRIGPHGVYEDRNARSWHANRAGPARGVVPEDAGEGAPRFTLVRREPAAYAYHDHRAHWMGGDRPPPGVDESDPRPQPVYDGEIALRYGHTPGVVRTRVDYVGGRTWWQRHGERLVTGGGVAAMLLVFVVDARRRRRRAAAAQST